MDQNKRQRLLEVGWRSGNAADFLKLTPEEVKYVEMKVALARYLQKKRVSKNLTQTQIAHIIHSSQSRVAKMERNDQTVSMDLIVKTLFALGVSRGQISRVISLPGNKMHRTAASRHTKVKIIPARIIKDKKKDRWLSEKR